MSELRLVAPFAGWFGSIDEVPDPVFAERMMGDGCAIDPIEGELRAPAAGIVIAVPASAHAVTLRLDNGAELLMHIGLDTVGLNGAGFTALVSAGARVAVGDALICFDLDAVGEAAQALITPIVVANGGYVLRLDATGRVVAAGETIGWLSGEGVQAAGASGGVEYSRDVSITAAHGIHARPAARIAATLRPFTAEVALQLGEKRANARSTVALLGLGARAGDIVTIAGAGDDARGAVDAVAALILAGLGEEVGAPPVMRSVRAGRAVTAAPGLAIGQVIQLRAVDLDVPEDGAGVAHERQALACALATVAAGLGGGNRAAAEIAEAHRALLGDPELADAAERGIAAGRSAAFAWRSATRSAADAIRATGDALLIERVADLADLERQVIARLLGDDAPAAPKIAPDTILIAEDLLPSQFLALDRARLAGIVTAAGGPTAHVAILAASAGVPMLVAAGAAVLDIPDGRTVVLDADQAVLDADPGVGALAAASERLAEARERRARDLVAATAVAETADGARIHVFANLGAVEEVAGAVAAGAEGCGLLRTEFLFLDRDTAPDEAEQRHVYRRIAAALGDRPLIVRTLDIGGDKPVPYLPMPVEENPALGLRGVRLSLARPDLMRMQLRAILAAVPAPQCHIMLPMVVDLAELREIRAMLDETRAALGIAAPVPLGVMIETPAAAILADQLAAEADFLSIGTNDLTQYALASDRGNAAVSAKLDALHPAVLRLVREVGRGAHAHGRWAGVCGGVASDPIAAPILIGLGMTELSVTPAALPALKAAVRRLSLPDCVALAGRACAATSAAEVRVLASEVL